MSHELRVLIVDDEKMVREGIMETLPWDELHIRVVGTASNGRDALELVRELKPHIVLTDVRMPFLDGLGLIELIRQEAPQIKTIILSAYDEFEYARKALQLGAVDYLIKPVQAEELSRILSKTVESFEEDLKKEIFLGDIRKQVRDILPEFLKSLKERRMEESIQIIRGLFPSQLRDMGKYGRDILTILVQELHLSGSIPSSCLEALLSDIRTSSELLHSACDLELFLQIITSTLADSIMKNQRSTIPPMIQMVVEHVYERYRTAITVQSIAKWIGLNPDYFSHVFKSCMGVNFIEFVNRYRIDRAEELLQQTHSKVYEVAEQVGFQDYKYFAKLFHQWKGYRPTDVRRS